MFNVKLELIVPIGFIILSLLVFFEISDLSKVESAFPRLIAIMMMGSAIVLLITTLVKREPLITIKGSSILNVLIVAGALALYIVLLPHIGYIISSTALGSFLIFLLGYRKIFLVIASCTAFSCAVFFIFKVFLNVPLPTLFLNF